MRVCGLEPVGGQVGRHGICSRGQERVAGGEVGRGVQVAVRVDEAGERRLDLGGRFDQAPDGQLRRVQGRATDSQRLGRSVGVVAEVVTERQGIGLDVVFAGEGGGPVVPFVRVSGAICQAGERYLVVGADDDEIL